MAVFRHSRNFFFEVCELSSRLPTTFKMLKDIISWQLFTSAVCLQFVIHSDKKYCKCIHQSFMWSFYSVIAIKCGNLRILNRSFFTWNQFWWFRWNAHISFLSLWSYQHTVWKNKKFTATQILSVKSIHIKVL